MSVSLIRSAVSSAYDLQKLRIEMGGRLVNNFRAKLGFQPGEHKKDDDSQAQMVLEELKQSWKRLTDGIARNRHLPDRRGFTGDSLITDYAELALVDSYFETLRREADAFKTVEYSLEGIPIWEKWLKHVHGVGPATGGMLVSRFDPHKAHHVSCFWAFVGLDVAKDGRARGRFKEHLVEREFTKKDGTTGVKMSLTYDAFLHTKLIGVIAPIFLKMGSPYKADYNRYKHSINTDPNRIKCTEEEKWNFLKTIEDPEQKRIEKAKRWTPMKIHRGAIRYMLKRFIADFWENWRKLEGLPTGEDYNEWRRNRAHGEGYRQVEDSE